MKKLSTDWNIYRTRFLVKARQLTQPLSFIDALGRDHSGRAGDYLVEWSDGSRRVAPRQIFEDVYVVMDRTPESLVFAGERNRPVNTSAGRKSYAGDSLGTLQFDHPCGKRSGSPNLNR